jgi:predicted ATPase
MPSERVQRQIDRLLDEAEQAIQAEDWATVEARCRSVLTLDPGNADAASYQAAAARVLGSPPPDALPTTAPSLPAAFVDGRYVVQELLGEGGKKVVYYAHDTRLDRDVAFALLKAEGLDATARERLQREARALGRLSEHPHIVTVFEVGEEDGQPYLVTELLRGGDLAQLLARTPEHRLPLPRVLELTTAVAQALAFAHEQGVVHRDLKPGNIWLSQDGTAKLGDFGLALAADQARVTQAGLVVGTALYLAPEQATGQDVTPRSDLYSLGCLLYELVTGRPPFVGDAPITIIGQHLHATPVAPSWHRPDCPPGLEALTLRLLEKDPARRPASADEVVKALVAFGSAPATPPSAPQPALPPSGNPVYRRTFVGREAELRQLEAACDGAVAGQGGLVMVVGEPGIGKTTLTEQLSTYAALRGGRVLVGHCYEEGSLSLPYLPFVEALRSYVLERAPDQLRGELGSGAPEVARLVSEVRDRVQVSPSEPSADPSEDRYRLFTAVSTFLRHAAAIQPLVLVLEDLHDADRGTLQLLQFLARQLNGARLLLVGTYRDVEVDRAHPLSAALAELRRGSRFSRVALRGLTADEVQRMFSGITGQEESWRLSEAVYRQTEGNPLFVQEVVRYLVEEGLITREGGRWRPAGSTPLVETIPEGLRDVIGKRLSRLSEACNRLLAVAAVIGRDFQLATLVTVLGAPEEAVTERLAEAVKVAVLQEQARPAGVRYRFAHAFFRQTLYEELGAARRLRLHQRVARALEQQYASRLEEHAAELAEHFAQSTDAADLTKAVHYGAVAAERAMAVYAHGEAVRLVEQALDVQEVLDPADTTTRCDLLLALSDALLPLGEHRRALEVVLPEVYQLAEALGDDRRAAAAADRGVFSGLRLTTMGASLFPAIRAEWLERLERHAQPDTPEGLRLELWRAEFLRPAGRWGEASRRLLGVVEAARRQQDGETLALALPPALVAPVSSTWAATLALARASADLPRAGVSPIELLPVLSVVGFRLLDGGERARAEALWQEEAALVDRTGDPYGQLRVVREQLRLALVDGRFAEAAALGERLVALGEEHDLAAVGRSMASGLLFRLQLITGQYEAALQQSLPVAFFQAELMQLLAHAHLGKATREELRALLTARTAGAALAETAAGPSLLFLLEAALRLGDGEQLPELLALLAPVAASCLGLAANVLPARLLGEAAAQLGERKQARAYYEQALAAGAQIGFRPELALTRLARAELLSDGDAAEQEEAREQLGVAVAELEAMGMSPALARAQALQTRLAASATSGPPAPAAGQTQSRRPRRRASQPAGTVTFLFSDVVSSMPEFQRRGDRLGREFFRRHDELCQEQAARFGGHVYRREGDGFFIAFQSTREALRCAIAIQHGLPQAYADAAERPHVRIGLHVGETVEEAGEYYGGAVNLAARVRNEAVRDQILVTELVQNIAAGEPALRCRFVREASVKGFDGAVRLYEVLWQAEAG